MQGPRNKPNKYYHLLLVPEVAGHSSHRAAYRTHILQDGSAFKQEKEEIQVKSSLGSNIAYWINIVGVCMCHDVCHDVCQHVCTGDSNAVR